MLTLLLALTMAATEPPQAPADPAAGVPLAVAEARAARISDLKYNLRFDIPEKPADPIAGRVAITFALKDASQPLVLDFAPGASQIRTVTDGTRALKFTASNEHVVIPASELRKGPNTIAIEFVAGDASLNRTAEFMYTLFVPARARLAFPCFDQPDLKARYSLSLVIPAAWEALANGAETARESIDGGRTRLTFSETQPLPTYLFAFAAGKFKIETAERNGRTFRMFHRETDAEKVARNRDTIFDLHAASLAWLERYTGIAYPFGKFDFLLVPAFQFGGMEHAGAIFYNASGLLLDPSATQNQKLGRASVIAHETAHMWFGDLVTMRWFNDVWMKEVFANFMAGKIVNPSFPEINHELRFLYANYPAAYDVDRTQGTNAIRQKLDNLSEAGSLYGAIIYQKAPIVMRQLEMILGEERFREGLQEYLGAHRFANATWPDLIAVLDKRTPDDLATWSHAWVEEAGRPAITTNRRVAGGTIESLSFDQQDPVSARGLAWTERLHVTLGYGETSKNLDVTLNARHVDVPSARGLPAPLYVLPTGGGIGYGGFALDPTSRDYLLAHLADIPDPLTRGSALVTLWEDMLDGRSRPSALLDTLAAALPRESDELNVQRMLGYTQQAYWKFVSPETRTARVPVLERLFKEGLDRAATPSLKSAWFSALRDTAQTPATLEWLEKVFRKTEMVPGLVLAEPDYINLAQALALRAVPAWKEILDLQEEATKNPDRKAQFAFVRPALSPDASVRDAFFDSLADVKNRRREPWVLEGLSFLHHPLRAAASEKYIPRSLALLQDIQRTGDIFFPKRWMDATLSGHRTASAARMVTAFLTTLPANYPDRLRRIVLSAADDLFRASRAD
ncbi:MAG TPA: M1 family aminopeptidase [Vicinamibacterales bacterium]